MVLSTRRSSRLKEKVDGAKTRVSASQTLPSGLVCASDDEVFTEDEDKTPPKAGENGLWRLFPIKRRDRW